MATSVQPQQSFHSEPDLWFERLIARLSSRFISLDTSQLDGEIVSAQELVCDAFDLDRSTLAQWDVQGKKFAITHSWARAGFESAIGFTAEDFPWGASRLQRGQEVCFSRISDLPKEALKDQETAIRFGLKSCVVFPMQAGALVIGVLSFGTLRSECEWPELTLERLRLVAGMFANALVRKRDADELLESQHRTRMAAESAGLGFWTWNIGRDEFWASEKTLAVFGRPPATSLTYEDFLNAVHPENRESFHGSIAAAALLPMEFELKHRVVRPDGGVRWVCNRGRSDADATGKAARLSGVIFDITQHIFAEERFRLAVESAPTAMVMADMQGKIVMANAQVERIFGYRREEILGQAIDTLVPERFLNAHVAFREVFAKNPVAKAMGAGRELYGLRKDGSEFRVDIGLNPIQTDEGMFVLTSVTDITDRIEAVDGVRRSEEAFRAIANSAPVLIWTSGTDKQVTFLNARWLAFTGRTMEEEVGEGWALGVHPEDLDRCIEIYSASFDARVEFEMEYRLRRFDGEYRWIVDQGAPIFKQDGTFTGYVGSCLDITDRKRSERELVEVNEHLLEATERIVKLKEQVENENVYLQKEIIVAQNHQEVVGRSDAIRRVLMKAEQVAPTNSAVLLLGETGTGKELIARAIHRNSKRKDRLMVKVNCAALPATLVENELFGREKGAYTGALSREIGRFELANESTIFLDEIGELPLELQAKLLRVLQEGEFERLGSPRTIRVDVRVIAATSRDLEAAMREGKFREDLYYRLNVFPIRIPPLRERAEDIPMLAWYFLRDLGGRMGKDVESVRASTMTAFQNYTWPGNVRELRNLIERHLITNTGSVFEAELPKATRNAASTEETAEQVEREHLRRVLERTGWRIRGKGAAAETLGLKPTTLESRMKRLGIFRQ